MERKKIVFSIRPSVEHLEKIEKALKDKKEKENRPSLNNTIEAVLLEHFKIK